jgi:diaminopimelate decarboxylase
MSDADRRSLFAFNDEEALDLAERHPLPCFAYRLDSASMRYDELRAALPSRAVLAYAVKANPGRELVETLASRGASFDCASIGELELVRGVLSPASETKPQVPMAKPQIPSARPRVLFAGPGKSLEELSLALDMDARIEVDGIEDLEMIEGILSESSGRGSAVHKRRPPLAVSLRVHPATGISEENTIIGGSGPSAFGVDEEELPDFLSRAACFELVRITGLQVFAASNERSAERLLANHRAVFAIGEALQGKTKLPLDLIDLGGGLGIPYSEEETELDIPTLGAGIGRLLGENPWFTGKVVLEPGRWIAGPCGVYLARVVRTKRSRGVDFAVLEGGINHLLRPLLTGQSFPVAAPRAARADDERVARDVEGATTLAGPLCTSLDRLGTVRLPPLKAGDLVMFGQAGAYGATEAMKGFLSRPEAEEYWLY